MSNYVPSVFNTLYEYSQAGGTVAAIPDLPTLRGNVADGFREIFAPTEFNTDPETPGGVLIDAIALMMYNTLGIVVQNLNGLNIDIAASQYLDALGRIFGVERNGDTDDDYRRRILESQSRGIGTVYGVRQALSQLTAIDGFVVLENNTPNTLALPSGEANAVEVGSHSIYVSVIAKPDAGTEETETPTYNTAEDKVTEALYNTKAAGCAYSAKVPAGQRGILVTKTIEDENTNSSNTVKFIRAQEKENVSIEVTMDPKSYSGADLTGDIERAIREFVRSRRICSVITKTQVMAAIAEYGHATARSVVFKVGADTTNSLVVFPYEYIDSNKVTITVS